MIEYGWERQQLDRRIVNYVETNRLNLRGFDRDIQRKREFLRKVMGYTRLTIGKNESAPLEDCNDGRISLVVKGLYSSAKKRLAKLVLSA